LAPSGNAWYTQCATRAVNQALGRVIRHKADFGVIVLADERFASPHMRAQVSYWARSLLTVQQSFGGLAEQLGPFFAANRGRDPVLALAAAGGGGAMLGATASGPTARGAATARRAFQPPKLAAAPRGDRGEPVRAGSAVSGASALRAMERSMAIPSARDICGLACMASAPAAALSRAPPQTASRDIAASRQRAARARQQGSVSNHADLVRDDTARAASAAHAAAGPASTSAQEQPQQAAAALRAPAGASRGTVPGGAHSAGAGGPLRPATPVPPARQPQRGAQPLQPLRPQPTAAAVSHAPVLPAPIAPPADKKAVYHAFLRNLRQDLPEATFQEVRGRVCRCLVTPHPRACSS